MDRINISDTLLSDNTLGSNNTRASLSTTVNNYSDLTYATNGNRTMNGSIINAHHTNGTTASYAYDYEEGNDDEEEEEITPSELIEKLQQCWLNEKFTPKLLEHKTGVVDCIIEQIKHMEANILTAKKGDFRIAIHKLELDRIKFMLYTYLRLRIKKIEQFCSHLLEEDNKHHPSTVSKMSAEEQYFSKRYFKNVRQHLKASVLDHLPVNLQDLNEAVTMPKPDLDKFVFLKSLENLKGVLIDDLNSDGRSEIVDMEKHDLYVMRYRPIDQYIEANQVQLI